MPLINYIHFVDSSDLKDFEVFFISKTILNFLIDAFSYEKIWSKREAYWNNRSLKNELMQALCVEPVKKLFLFWSTWIQSKHEPFGPGDFQDSAHF